MIRILAVDNVTSSTLETIATAFHRNFSRFDHFRVGTALVSVVIT